MFITLIALPYVNLLTTVLLLSVLIAGLMLMKRRNDSGKRPPGPKGFPIVGNLLSLSFHPERDLSKWNKMYGPVCHLRFATLDFVVLGSLEAIKEAFVKKRNMFSDRLQDSVPPFSGDSGIIFMNYSNRFKAQKRFGLATLKLFGMGRKTLEPKILEMCVDLGNRLKRYSESEEPVDLKYVIYEAVSTVISQMVFNKNLPRENDQFRQWLRDVANGSKYGAINAIAAFYPALKVIPPFCWGAQEANAQGIHTYNLLQKQIDEHKLSCDAAEPRDFIDCFLQEMKKRNTCSVTMAEEQGFTYKQLNDTARDIFLAGFETTSTTLRWTLLFLCKYLQCQSMLHKEIDEILNQRPPTIDDENQMNYTKAVIQEVLRMRPVTPIVPHVASEDSTISGYQIKKGTCVAANLFHIFHDESLWPEPETFNPTRHLDETGKFVEHPSLIPFSIGARQCLGIQMAKMELFLFLISMFQKFSFELNSEETIDMRGENVFALRPYPFKVIVKRRQKCPL